MLQCDFTLEDLAAGANCVQQGMRMKCKRKWDMFFVQYWKNILNPSCSAVGGCLFFVNVQIF